MRSDINRVFFEKVSNFIFALSILSLVYAGYIYFSSANNLETYFLGYKPVVINNKAMGKELPLNSIAIVQNKDIANIEEGDIVSYIRSDKIVTHRLIKINEDGSIITKADTSSSNDPYNMTLEDLSGKVVFKTPSIFFLKYGIFDFLRR